MKKVYALIVLLMMCSTLQAALPAWVDGKELPSLAPMLERATPAVVNIATRGKVRVASSLFNDPFFQRFFNMPGLVEEKETASLGSGVIIDARYGYVLTNNHVIEDALEIQVTLHDGREYLAEVIGKDPDTDIAVIKIKPDNLTALKFADSSQLRVGDFVVAIGNPFGLGQTVTSGIVSALGRSGLGIESYEDFIQTDASINVGNSGGALVNLNGELVGINTAILGSEGSSGSIGIGFAIPINLARDIMQQLVEIGEVKRGRLGLEAQDLTPQLATAFQIDASGGAVVTGIEQGSPADKAGLKVGDVIIQVNGRQIRSSVDIHNLIGLMRLGQQVELDILRGGRSRLLVATIEQFESLAIDGSELHLQLAGAKIAERRETRLHDGSTGYLLIDRVEKGSAAWSTGLRSGDIIYSINRQRITTLREAFTLAVQSRTLLITLQRGQDQLYLLLK